METTTSSKECPVCKKEIAGTEQDCLADTGLSLDAVSAFAGDRPLTEQEKGVFDDSKKTRGDKFFSCLLYTITHQYFPPALARNLWEEILRHKYEMSALLMRNIRITVASLDYLSNLKGELHSPTVIDETRIAAIVELSLRDGLTKLYNHSTCYQKIQDELNRFNRYGTIFSIMMIDIDDFKNVNDQSGHVEGDRVLSILGTLLKEETRLADICCRYGGEEFIIILPSTDIQEAGVFAERVRLMVEKSRPSGHRVTVSIGVASCGEKLTTAQSLVEKADAEMYKAKKHGKNRVFICRKTDD